MANRKMALTFSANGEKENNAAAQIVSFVNVLEGSNITSNSPEIWPYENRDNSIVALLNFQPYTIGSGAAQIDIKNSEGEATIRSSEELSVAIYKREMAYDSNGNVVAVSDLIPVSLNQSAFHLRDMNVTNGRWYEYVLYPANKMAPLVQVQQQVKTKWNGWSVTELHPLDATMTRFSATSEDVWVFNLNVETGEQTQQIVRQEQQTLGQFPRYSQGLQNYITGNVNCLLGRDVLPASWIERNGKLINEGGYQEKLPFTSTLSSNDKVDMLYAWRKLVYSHNPKLLKDRKGQSFIVTINSSSNSPNNMVAIQPDTISFTWTQIQSLEGVTIVDTSLGGE